jgi:hypothetical protein
MTGYSEGDYEIRLDNKFGYRTLSTTTPTSSSWCSTASW